MELATFGHEGLRHGLDVFVGEPGRVEVEETQCGPCLGRIPFCPSDPLGHSRRHSPGRNVDPGSAQGPARVSG